jgi:ATP-dependent helicase Lhr and Lhr-like helicase
MSAADAFNQLAPQIQRYLWSEQWESLRDVQIQSIPLVLDGTRDVVIAAATASGKTEAAFLPALTRLLATEPLGLIVYISPLKALINDQFGRLERLCAELEIPVCPWHGDIGATAKRRFLKAPAGVLLITPESLEAMLCNRGTSIGHVFARANYFVIDELHAFIGSERGKQLQSILHRIERVVDRAVPRIGLSATLGDMQLAADFLRPGGDVAIVDAESGESRLLVTVKGYEEAMPAPGSSREPERAPVAIAQHLFRSLRGTNNLVFPNSRREVERYTHLLNELCDEARVPNEFWPHHGNLSTEIRTDTEAALKQKEKNATAVCTNTLELGIDIGAVKSVAQIGPPPSVASLRQRLGRSGRRAGEAAILRGYIIEDALNKTATLGTRLRLDTVRTAAVISLLLEGWFEPPVAHGAHLSTLVQQLLSSIAQYGGMSAPDAHRLLCGKDGPFETISQADFIALLQHLGSEDLVMMDSSRLLLHGVKGEQYVNHYTFYAAFEADDEFRIVAGGKLLGTLPITQMLMAGQRIVFAGRTWLVDDIDDAQKTIHVSAAKGGAPPLFSGSGGRVHTMVRQRMRELYRSDQALPYLDETAQRFVDEGRACFSELRLNERWLLEGGTDGTLVTWLGDSANEAIACLLAARGIDAISGDLGVDLRRGERSWQDILVLIADIARSDVPSIDVLLANAKNLIRAKWDWALPPPLLRKSYASLNLSLDEAITWLRLVSTGSISGPSSMPLLENSDGGRISPSI